MNYPPETKEKGHSEVAGSAESAARTTEIGQFDADLTEVIEAWAELSESEREAVLRIVREATNC